MAEKEVRPSRSLTSFRPFRDLSELQDEVNRLWDSMWGPRFWRPMRRPPTEEEWIPAVDIYQKDNSLLVKAEVPGLSEKDIEITVTKDTLTLSGEKTEEKEVKEENYYRSERSHGKFSRQVALPPGADADKAKASFKDGVLQIEIPLKEVPKQKKVEITSNA